MTTVEICNMALVRLGIPPVVSLDESGETAGKLRAFFPALRDRLLSEHSWSFATKSDTPPLLSEESPDPQFEFVLGMPPDCIRIIETEGNRPFRRIGFRILTDLYPVKVLYTARVTDPGLFDPRFTEALIDLLTAELAMAGTRDANLAGLYRNEYERALLQARSEDSRENRGAYRPRPRRSSWIEARFRR